VCNVTSLVFVGRYLVPNDVQGKRVVELGVGPFGAKPMLMAWRPREYLGVDVHATPWADVVASEEKTLEILGAAQFDVVLGTEMLEHVRDWRLAVNNIKRLCKPGGHVVLTTRSQGYRFHAPPDYWRYEVADLKRLFADFDSVCVESDPLEPGVFVSAVRPTQDTPLADLSSIELYSMVYRRRVREIPPGPLSPSATFAIMWKERLGWGFRIVVDTIRGRPPYVHFVPENFAASADRQPVDGPSQPGDPQERR
jgi:SAM-dependent methyltransferase